MLLAEYIHTLSAGQVLEELKCNADYGLTSEDAQARFINSKRSMLRPAKKRSIFLRIIDQFMNLFVLLLVAFSVILAVFGDGLAEAVITIIILIITMIIGVIVNNRAGKALLEIKNAGSLKTNVKRDGEIISINAHDVVAGDIVILNKGDCLPADIRIIDSSELKIDESSITGETVWVNKSASAIPDINALPGTKTNLAYMGSIITCGSGIGVAYAIGKDTHSWRNTVITDPVNDSFSPLLHRLNITAKSLGAVCIIACVLTAAIGILYNFLEIGIMRGIPELLVLSLALAVTTTPNEIAVLSSVIMAVNTQNMVNSCVAAKNLHSVETLGKTTVICTGKTGILTQNNMTITRVADPEHTYEVTGIGYKAKGHVVAEVMITRNIALMSEIVVLCNNAHFDERNEQISGDPTEGAMLVFGAKLGHDKYALNKLRPRLYEMPFDPERKMMSTINKDGNRMIMYSKGAAEEIITRSSYVYLDGEIVFMSDAVRLKLMKQNDEFAARAYRVLACAYKVYEDERGIDSNESDLIYVGMMALTDPLREDMASSVVKCRNAGIGVKIITGEHRNTVKAMAQAFGIIKGDDEVINSGDIDDMTDEQLCSRVREVNVFSRVTPVQKLRIVTALKADIKNIVAVTGNNLEDVPSLEIADIGIAMGTAGCEVTKQKADAVIVDDSFAGIINSIIHGRTIFANIRKAIIYVLACNLAVLLLVFLSVLLTLAPPLAITHLLLLNLLIYALPVLSIGMEVNEPGVINKKPRNPEDTVINRRVVGSGITRAVFIFTGSLAAYLYGLFVAVAPDGVPQQALAMSMCFFTLAAGELLAAYPSKTETPMMGSAVMFKNKHLNITVLFSLLILFAVLYIPGLNSLLSFVPLTIGQFIICTVIIVLTIICFEISKLYTRH